MALGSHSKADCSESGSAARVSALSPMVPPPAAVSQFESGASRPSQETLGELADQLAVPIEFLSLPLVETHEGFFRSLRRTAVADRRLAPRWPTSRTTSLPTPM